MVPSSQHSSKKRFAAQQMVMLLGTLAHNVIVWAQQWLTPPSPPTSPQSPAPTTRPRAPLQGYGIVRMVRDVFHLSGYLRLDASGQIVEVVLNQNVPLARRLLVPLQHLLAPLHVGIRLDKTEVGTFGKAITSPIHPLTPITPVSPFDMEQ